MFNDAVLFAYNLFVGVNDKAGAPYIGHCLSVAENARNIAHELGYDADLIEVAAVLHDVIEDCDISFHEVADRFGLEVAMIVDNVSKRDGERKADYLNRVRSLPESMIVKAADALHNSMSDRFINPSENDLRNCARYRELYELLISELS